MGLLFSIRGLVKNGTVFFYLGIFLCIGLATEACAGTIISENYEVPAGEVKDGGPNATSQALIAKGWGIHSLCYGYCSIDIVSTPVHSGSGALRLTYKGVGYSIASDGTKIWEDIHNANINRNFTPIPEIYARYYFRTEPIPPATQSNYASISSKQHYLMTTSQTNAVLNHFWGDRRVMIGDQNAVDGLWTPKPAEYPNNIPLMDNKWYCVEYHYKFNTHPDSSNGLVEIWVDGIPALRRTGRRMLDATNASTGFKRIEIYRQSAENMYRYEDDYVMATTRIGCNTVIDTAAPAAPSNLTATVKSLSQIDLSWTNNANNQLGFKVEKSLIPTGNFAPMTPLPVETTNYSAGGLGSNRTYYFRVCAVNASGKTSAYSSVVSATTSATKISGERIVVSGQKVNSYQFAVNSGKGKVKFTLPKAGAYQLSVYDLSGREVWKHEGSSSGTVEWRHGGNAKEGVYLARMHQGATKSSEKFCTIK